MRSGIVRKAATLGALVTFYQLVVAVSPLYVGVFKQHWSGITAADFSGQAQRPNLIELLKAAQQASDSSVAVLTRLSKLGQDLALREAIGSGAAFVLFAVILYLELTAKRRPDI